MTLNCLLFTNNKTNYHEYVGNYIVGEVTDESVIPEGVAIQEYGIIGAEAVSAVNKIEDNNIVFENYTPIPGTEYSLRGIEYPVSKAPQGSKSDTAT